MTEENYTGVTTGTVATACSLAAIDAILDSPDIVCVTVETPKKSLDILIDSCSKLSDTSACAVAHKNPYNESYYYWGGRGWQNHKTWPSNPCWRVCN